MSHPAPTRPWQKVGVDIFTFSQQDYLITVDYLTGYFEIDRLPSKRISDIMYCLKQQFARHGLPDELVSDNSPFQSAEFKRFAEQYEFKYTTSSPRYPQSNGRVENSVRTAKRLMTKAAADNYDPFLALLDWRNTPSEQLGPSPVQLMFGRRTRTLLPSSNKLLVTPSGGQAHKALTAAKQRQAVYYNVGAKEKPPFKTGQTVRVKLDDNRKEWNKGQIVTTHPHRSYDVKLEDGTVRRRTSRHIRFSSEPPIVCDNDIDITNGQPATIVTPAPPSSGILKPSPSVAPSVQNNQTVTRYGRRIVKPARYRQ